MRRIVLGGVLVGAAFGLPSDVGSQGYILTESGDCLNAENGDRLITEDASAGVGPCVGAAAAAPPQRTMMGVGQ